MNRVFKVIVVLIFAVYGVKAQDNNPKFGIGVNTDIFSLSLNSDVEMFSTDIFASYSINDKFNILLSSRNGKLLNTETKQYKNNNAGMIGFGYRFQKESSPNFSTLVQLMYGNTFSKSVSYSEHIVDLGANFYFYKMFYIGTGLKTFYIEDTKFINSSSYNINWYWQLGFQLYFGKK